MDQAGLVYGTILVVEEKGALGRLVADGDIAPRPARGRIEERAEDTGMNCPTVLAHRPVPPGWRDLEYGIREPDFIERSDDTAGEVADRERRRMRIGIAINEDSLWIVHGEPPDSASFLPWESLTQRDPT